MEDAAPVKRFYTQASVLAHADGWQVQLDTRGVKTVGGLPQIVPSAALADALAAEWASQGETIAPGSLILRDMADYALDCVLPDRAAAAATLLRFAESDTLCYRADAEDPLAARQSELWEPLLRQAEARWDVQFERIAGIIHRPQPAATLARMHAVLAALGPFQLAALNTLASLAASLVIGLAALDDGTDAATLWDAANLEEDWQVELWGEDADAAALRAKRLALFTAAQAFARLARC